MSNEQVERLIIENSNEDGTFDMKGIAVDVVTLLEQARKQAASDIMNLANEYANQDKTMRGSEEIRNYHYFNAINKVGGFDGR